MNYISVKLLLQKQNATVNQAKMLQVLTKTGAMEMERSPGQEGEGEA